jgi:hypothetical protein
MKSHMFAVDMGSCDIVLGAKWLRTLGPILIDFKELTMQFNKEGQQVPRHHRQFPIDHQFPSHGKILKKSHYGIIAQLHAIQATETPSMLQDFQSILSKHKVVFSTAQGLPPSSGVHDRSILLVPNNVPPNVRPYRHPFS